MATTAQDVPLGTPGHPFSLPTADGGHVALDDLDAPVVCVVFACNHCPYVRHVEDELGRIAQEHDDVAFVAICSNDTSRYPDDAPERLVEQARRASWGFPYAVDADSAVARAYGAACTPDVFVLGRDRTLVYRGAVDASSPGNGKPHDGAALRAALRHAVAGEPVPEPHQPAMGCGIKWADA